MRGFVRRRGSTYTWYFDVPDPVTGKRKQYSKGGFRTKKACQQALNEVLATLRTGTFVEPSGRTLAGFLVEEWLSAVRPPAQGAAFNLAQLPEERGAPHRSRPRAPAAAAAHAGPAHQLLPDAAGARPPGWLRRIGAQDRPQHPRRLAHRPPRCGALGLCRPQRRRCGRPPQGHDARDARVESPSSFVPSSSTFEAIGCTPPGCC